MSHLVHEQAEVVAAELAAAAACHKSRWIYVDMLVLRDCLADVRR